MSRPRTPALFVLLSVALTGLVPAAAGASSGPPSVSRWFGAEAGFMETACYGPGSGCPAFSVAEGLGGGLSTWDSQKELLDPDGVSRPWPARTGNLLFLTAVPGGVPGFAHLSTVGSQGGPVRPGTVSFAVRIHTLPGQPVVIYQHMGGVEETPVVTIALTQDGKLALSAPGGVMGVSEQTVSTMEWHTLTLTYGSQDDTPIRLDLDERVAVAGTLPLGGPSGHLNLGIVTPTTTPFALGIDDYVESPAFDAPIGGARVNYLMPLGRSGPQGWDKSFHTRACKDLAENWQLISEDQRVTVIEDGTALTCELAGAVTTTVDGAVDEYRLEGIPSRHKPSPGYRRDVLAQPRPGEAILGVRLRMEALTGGTPFAWTLGYHDEGAYRHHEFTFDGGGSFQTRWSPDHPLRPAGAPWTSEALGNLRLSLNSGTSSGVPVTRSVAGVRLDYVWIP